MFQKSTNQEQVLPVTDQNEMSNLHRGGPSIHASYQVSIHLADLFQRRIFLEIDQSETRIAYGGHVYKRIGIKLALFSADLPRMLSTKFRFIQSSGLRGDNIFRNQPIRNKNCLLWPCLLMDWDKICNLYREPSIDQGEECTS